MNKRSDQTAPRLVDEVGVELDELRRAGDQLDEAVALQFGLNRTDLRCLGILYRRGRVTAGELAEESGLTPGAITTVLDRLERGGYANRVPDPADRRRVLVVSTVATREIGARIQGEVELASRRLLEGREAAELTCIRDFLRGTRSVYEAQIAALTAEARRARRRARAASRSSWRWIGRGRRRRAQPRWGAPPAGRLEFTKGAAKVDHQGRPVIDRPVPGRASRARCPRSPSPAARSSCSSAAASGPSTGARQSARLRALDRRAWDISLRGGMWKLAADLSALRVTSLEVTGGASDIEVRLPAPAGPCRCACPAAPARSRCSAPRHARLARR